MRFFLLMRNLRVKQRTIESLSNQHKAKKMSDFHKGLSVACQYLFISELRPVWPTSDICTCEFCVIIRAHNL